MLHEPGERLQQLPLRVVYHAILQLSPPPVHTIGNLLKHICNQNMRAAKSWLSGTNIGINYDISAQ